MVMRHEEEKARERCSEQRRERKCKKEVRSTVITLGQVKSQTGIQLVELEQDPNKSFRSST